jgi:hypothetical protein
VITSGTAQPRPLSSEPSDDKTDGAEEQRNGEDPSRRTTWCKEQSAHEDREYYPKKQSLGHIEDSDVI